MLAGILVIHRKGIEKGLHCVCSNLAEEFEVHNKKNELNINKT